MMQTTMKRQIRYLTYVLYIEAVQIIFNVIMTVLALSVPYSRDLLLVRIFVQVCSGALFIVISNFIAYKSERADQANDNELGA